MKNKKKHEIVVTENKDVQIAQQSPMALATSFLDGGGKLENLEKMLELQEKYDKMQAKKAFVIALANFKAEPITIAKDKDNKQYNSKYSSIGAIVNTCLPRMGKFGLSHKWEFDPQTDQKFLTGYCVIIHSAGHSDRVSMTAPIDTSGSKNPIQQIKSTRTYIKIETFASLMGLASSEDLDDDGNSTGVKLITENQAIEIQEAIDGIKDFSNKDFLKWAKVDAIEDIHLSNLGKVKAALKARSNQ